MKRFLVTRPIAAVRFLDIAVRKPDSGAQLRLNVPVLVVGPRGSDGLMKGIANVFPIPSDSFATGPGESRLPWVSAPPILDRMLWNVCAPAVFSAC